jgi:hypothetical protein
MEMIYSRELGISVVSDKVSNTNETELSLSDALALYQRLKGMGKTKLFFEVSNRSIRYLIECVGHDKINGLEPADAGRFRDFLFDRGMSSSSVKRVFSSVRAIMNLAIKEHGLAMTNVFNGTFIPEDNKRKERLPVPVDVIRLIQGECRSLDDEPRWLSELGSGKVAGKALIVDQYIGFGTPYSVMQRSKAPIRIIFQMSKLKFFPVTSQKYSSLSDLDGEPIMLHSRGGGTDSIANVI